MYGEYGWWYEHFIHWAEGGTHLVFDHDDLILALDVAGAHVREVADVDPDYQESGLYDGLYRFEYGFYADVSPDGSRVVYSTCEYIPDELEPWQYSAGYEIAAVNIDGADKERLTENERFDHYPVWSPDGTQLATVANTSVYGSRDEEPFGDSVRLVIISPDIPGRDIDRLLTTEWVALYPPVWSPDGQRLAFIANDREIGDYRIADLYVIGSNGEGLTRIGETTAPATWSPDGEELAFASLYGDAPIIYAVRPDGTGRRTVWRGELNIHPAPNIYPEPVSLVSQVSWSPDGSELLFLAGGSYRARKEGFYTDYAYLVRSDGTDPRRLAPGILSTQAAWSPDGSRIALYLPGRYYQPGGHIVTISRDGTDLRFLVIVDEEGRIHALDPSLTERPVNLAACSAGRVVPEPEANPGLVHDCEVLLSVRGRGGGVELDWSESTPIGEWEGITLGGSPPRVHALILPRRYMRSTYNLTGTLPPELGRLAELRTLHITGTYLNGSIPPELGGLTKLRELDLSYNYLSGSIPPELDGLMKLRWLDLSGNYLSGGIPPELGRLAELRTLDLSYNYLGGSIPPELGNLTNLMTLSLSNRFTGCIPIALLSIEDEDLQYLGLPNCEEQVSP